MNARASDSMKPSTNARRDVPIARTRQTLMDAGYNRIAVHETSNEQGDLTCAFHVYAGQGELVILQIVYDNTRPEGFDVYVPIVKSARVDDTLAAIRWRAKAREEERLRADPATAEKAADAGESIEEYICGAVYGHEFNAPEDERSRCLCARCGKDGDA